MGGDFIRFSRLFSRETPTVFRLFSVLTKITFEAATMIDPQRKKDRQQPLSMYMNEILKKIENSNCKITVIADHANQHEHAAELTKLSAKFGNADCRRKSGRIGRQSTRSRQTNPRPSPSIVIINNNNKMVPASSSIRPKILVDSRTRAYTKRTENYQTARVWDPFDNTKDCEIEPIRYRRKPSDSREQRISGLGFVIRAA